MKAILSIIFCFLFLNSALAKTCFSDSLVMPQVRTSPTLISSLLTKSNKYIKLTYGQPLKKGRKIFGGLVPYNQVWRCGANEATEITISSDFSIGNLALPAGTYSLFSIPQEKSWKIIINKVLGQWGTFTYDASQNVGMIEIPVKSNSNIYEGFTIELLETKTDHVTMAWMWDTTLLEIPIIFNYQNPTKALTKRELRKLEKKNSK